MKNPYAKFTPNATQREAKLFVPSFKQFKPARERSVRKEAKKLFCFALRCVRRKLGIIVLMLLHAELR